MSLPTTHTGLKEKLYGYEEKLVKLNALLASDGTNEELLKLKGKLVATIDTVRLALDTLQIGRAHV